MPARRGAPCARDRPRCAPPGHVTVVASIFATAAACSGTSIGGSVEPSPIAWRSTTGRRTSGPTQPTCGRGRRSHGRARTIPFGRPERRIQSHRDPLHARMPAAPRTSVHGCFEPGGRGRPQLVEKGSDGLAGFGAEGIEASGAVSAFAQEHLGRRGVDSHRPSCSCHRRLRSPSVPAPSVALQRPPHTRPVPGRPAAPTRLHLGRRRQRHAPARVHHRRDRVACRRPRHPPRARPPGPAARGALQTRAGSIWAQCPMTSSPVTPTLP
jgi:hypothetical protein